MTRNWKAARLIYRVDKLWGGYNSSRRLSERLSERLERRRRRQGMGMREEGHRILHKKFSNPAPYQRRWNAHGEGPHVGGEGRSKPSALCRLSHLFSFFRARSGRRPRSNTYGGPSAGSRLQEWLLGRRGGGD